MTAISPPQSSARRISIGNPYFRNDKWGAEYVCHVCCYLSKQLHFFQCECTRWDGFNMSNPPGTYTNKVIAMRTPANTYTLFHGTPIAVSK